MGFVKSVFRGNEPHSALKPNVPSSNGWCSRLIASLHGFDMNWYLQHEFNDRWARAGRTPLDALIPVAWPIRGGRLQDCGDRYSLIRRDEEDYDCPVLRRYGETSTGQLFLFDILLADIPSGLVLTSAPTDVFLRHSTVFDLEDGGLSGLAMNVLGAPAIPVGAEYSIFGQGQFGNPVEIFFTQNREEALDLLRTLRQRHPNCVWDCGPVTPPASWSTRNAVSLVGQSGCYSCTSEVVNSLCRISLQMSNALCASVQPHTRAMSSFDIEVLHGRVVSDGYHSILEKMCPRLDT